MDSELLERLFHLKKNGVITEKEFEIQKRRILKENIAPYSSHFKPMKFIGWTLGMLLFFSMLGENQDATVDLQARREKYASSCHSSCQETTSSQKFICDCICLSLSRIMTETDFDFITQNGEDRWKQLEKTQKLISSIKSECSF